TQLVTKPYQSVGSRCLIERAHPGILPEVPAERCREKLEIPRVPRGDEVAVNDDPAILPDPAGLHHNRLDGEFAVLVGRELAIIRKARNPAALDDTGTGCEEHAATDACDQLVRRRNRPDEHLDAPVLTQDDRTLRPAGNKDAVKVAGIDCVDGIINIVGADFLEVTVDLPVRLSRRDYIYTNAKQLESEPRDKTLFFLKAICDQRGNAGLLGHGSLLLHRWREFGCVSELS